MRKIVRRQETDLERKKNINLFYFWSKHKKSVTKKKTDLHFSKSAFLSNFTIHFEHFHIFTFSTKYIQ